MVRLLHRHCCLASNGWPSAPLRQRARRVCRAGGALSWLVAALLLGSTTARASDTAFERCLAGLQQRAEAAGITPAIARKTLATVAFEQSVLDADRRQPEFTDTFANYLERRLTPARITQGQSLLRQHGELLDSIDAEYGVAPQYLVSFWGLETNYGGFFGKIPVLNSLATLACDARRADYFTEELLNALRIVARGDVDPDKMVGSWAGAMGHTQFMPSTWLSYAVDGDGDGRIDLWQSVPDAMASAARFLRAIGWQPGERWGREVRLPADFDYTQTGRQHRRPLAEWGQLGVTRGDGRPLPVVADMEAALIVPAGHAGPAFLVYPNFDVIMRWNRSEHYALSVGLLADRIAGAEGLQRQPPGDAPRLSRAQVERLQQRLAELGFDSGIPDGVFGPATRGAIRAYQQAQGRIADGYPDQALLEALGVADGAN